jgi:hypothetical protein
MLLSRIQASRNWTRIKTFGGDAEMNSHAPVVIPRELAVEWVDLKFVLDPLLRNVITGQGRNHLEDGSQGG